MDTTVKKFGTVNNIVFDEIFVEKEGEFMISFSDLGARINSWQVLNEQGEWENIVLGFDDAQHALERAGYYFGTTVGRVAGRIAHARFELDGETYHLTQNEGDHHIHGGEDSFDLRKWDYTIEEESDRVKLVFELEDKAGTNGYPGNLRVQVTHTITENNGWIISYKAKSDASTLFNPTNHVSFNLNGRVDETIENHVFELKANSFIPIDEENIPLGEIRDVEGTAFDLRAGQKFGDLLDSDDAQFKIHKGLDHPFVLEKDADYQGVISVPERNRQLYFQTTEPVVIIYTQNYTPIEMKIWGHELQNYAGFTLETQKEPDAINQPNFSSIVLEKDQIYESQTTYRLKNNVKGDES